MKEFKNFQYSWTEAFISCMERNMTLATIDTEQKSNEINQLVKKAFNGNKYLWVGGIMSRYPQRQYIWMPTGKNFNYTYWSSGQPNFDNGKQFCIHVGHDSNMKWNDAECYWLFGFICQTDQNKLKIENLQQQLQQELEKQQDMNKNIQEKEKREKLLQQELENLKETLKQQELKHLENQQKLNSDLENYKNKLKSFEDRKEISEKYLDKPEKLLQQELQSVKKSLKQVKHFDNEQRLDDNLENYKNKLPNLEEISENDLDLQPKNRLKIMKNPYYNIVHFH